MAGPSDSRERGVVPDLAEVLLVAVAVVLAVIVTTSVFGFVESFVDVGPTVAFAFEFAPGEGSTADCGDPTGGRLTVHHRAGDALDPTTVGVRGSSVPNANVDLSAPCVGIGDGMTAGESVSVAVRAEDTVRIVWAGENVSSQLGVWEGPSA